MSAAFRLLREYKQFITIELTDRLNTEGWQAYRRNAFSVAIYFYQLAREAGLQTHDRDLLSVVACDLARSYGEQGNLLKAVESYLEAKEIWQLGTTASEKIQTTLILAELGRTYRKMGQSDKATAVTLESLFLATTLRDTYSPPLLRLLSYANATAFSNLGDISYWEGDYKSALANQRRSLRLFEDLARGDAEYESQVIGRLIDIAWTHKALGDHPHALDCVSRGAEMARKSNRIGQLQSALNLLGVIYLDQGDYLSATQLLGQSLSMARAGNDKAQLGEMLVNVGAANLRLDRYDDALGNYEEALQSLEALEAKSYLRALIHQGLGVSYEAKGNYDAALEQFDKGLARADESGDKARLAELFWRKGQVRYRQQNLIEDHALSYAPSLSVLAQMSKTTKEAADPAVPTKPPPGLLAFGNPALSTGTVKLATALHRDEKLLPLPDAEIEVKALARVYPAGTSRVFVGADAQEAVAKAEMQRYRILHFATHGLLDNHNPMYSHIVLSQADPGKDEDGLLEAWEIMETNLKAEIAILSACETARGGTSAGEGVIGMSWALWVAGCPTTVASQWKVDSASTSDLMIEFHRNLMSRPASGKAEALRRAALKLLHSEKYRSPFYWAGFILMGDGR